MCVGRGLDSSGSRLWRVPTFAHRRQCLTRCVRSLRRTPQTQKIPLTIQYLVSVLIETLPSKSASHYFVIEKLALPQLVILFLTMWIILFKRYVVQRKKYTTRISLIQISSERNFITSVFGFSHINCRNAEKELTWPLALKSTDL